MVDRGELVEHYATADEQGRLTGGTSLERLRTQLLLRRALPAAPSRILDVGRGAGVHAARLAELGHSVHLVDAVPEHVEQARSAGTFTAALGDAVELAEPDHSYDAVLLLGPLYHLRRRSEPAGWTGQVTVPGPGSDPV
ncbi:class I SAM-dependent methyltransferase [Pseudonocardia sp. NPDC046786]|uniref:class I SAM-dependent methyltransferase n=1 Tax=Pseudonocardia sp. NPDC046786 TaxID=3155471 RepID=UPI0033D39E3E